MPQGEFTSPLSDILKRNMLAIGNEAIEHILKMPITPKKYMPEWEMSECYYIAMENGKLIFTFNDIGVPDCVEKGCLARADEALDMVCRMGDPDILECLVYRYQDSPGGIFTLRDKNGPLFCAVAKSNLIYAVALGYFGERVANARYGIDVFENLEEPDD